MISFRTGRLSFTISDNTVQGTFTPSRRIANNSARDCFAEELVANLESLLSSVSASGSGQLYRRAGTLFREFHETFYKTKAFQPLTTVSLALFISFLDSRNLSPSTILSYLSAIGYIHKMKGLHDPTKAKFLIQKLLTSLSRQKSCDVRLPISKPNLHDLVSSLQHTNSLAAQRILFSAMFLTAFYGFFRIGELPARSACHTTVISYDNIRFLGKSTLLRSQSLISNIIQAVALLTLFFLVMNLHHFVL